MEATEREFPCASGPIANGEALHIRRPLVTVPAHVYISGKETLGHALVEQFLAWPQNDGQAAYFRKVFHRLDIGIQVLR
jgi:hypothetical protein